MVGLTKTVVVDIRLLLPYANIIRLLTDVTQTDAVLGQDSEPVDDILAQPRYHCMREATCRYAAPPAVLLVCLASLYDIGRDRAASIIRWRVPGQTARVAAQVC